MRVLFSLILFLFGLTLNSQPAKKDSLLNALQSASQDTNRVKLLVQLGRTFGMMGDYNAALKFSEEALKLSEQLNFTLGLASSNANLAIIYKEKGNYSEALNYNFKALKIREQIGDQKTIAASLNNIATVYKELKDYEKALDYNRRSLEIKEKINDKYGIAASYNNMATIYNALKEYHRALEFHFKALKIREEINDEYLIGQSLGNIGNVYKQVKGYDSASAYMLKALRVKKKVKDNQGVAAACNNLANLFFDEGRLKEAEEYARSAREVAQSFGLIHEKRDAELALSEIYGKAGEYEKSLRHYKAYIDTRDSIFNEENTRDLVRAEMNFEFEKKENAAKAEQEKKDSLALEEKNRQQVIIWSIVGVLVLVVGFAVYAYRSFLQKKRANVEITRQKHIIEEKQKEILDSIHYARRIQNALLPSVKYVEKVLKNRS